jgi:pimeloyl-ACP methyl ester carboxylesterase
MAAWHRAHRPPPPERPPTVVVHGVEDVVIPVANATLLGERWGAARVERLQGCGHAAMAQEPERVAALIAAHGSSERSA